MTDKQIIFNCDVDCIHKNTEECFELECIYGQESILKQLARKEQECETLASQLDFEVQKKECLEQECERLKDYFEIKKIITLENGDLVFESGVIQKLVDENIRYAQNLELTIIERENLKEARKNSRCAWKSLEGTFCPEVQAQLDPLKSDNKHLNGLLDQALKELEEMRELKDEESLRVTQLATKCCQLEKAIEKVREICTKYKEICANCECDEYIDCVDCTEGGEAQVAIKVLQICDEVNDAN